MIETLPGEVYDKFIADRDDYLRQVFSCEPLDEAKISLAVKDCYRSIGEAEPVVLFFNDPVDCLIISAWFSKGQLRGQLRRQLASQLGGQLREQLGRQLAGQLGGQLGRQLIEQLEEQLAGQVRDQLGEQLEGQLRGHLRGQLREQLGRQLAGQLGGQLGRQLIEQLEEQLEEQLGNSIMPGWWKAMTFHYQKLNQIPGIKQIPAETERRLDAISTALDSQLWIPLRDISIICRPAKKIVTDHRQRIHNRNGPAIQYSKTKVYALEGIQVPEWVVTKPAAKHILKDLSNAEQRRAAFNHLGWEQAIKELDCNPIEINDDKVLGDLYRLNQEDYDILLVTNASPHPGGRYERYGLPCEKGLGSAIEAQASLLGLTVPEYESIEYHT